MFSPNKLQNSETRWKNLFARCAKYVSCGRHCVGQKCNSGLMKCEVSSIDFKVKDAKCVQCKIILGLTVLGI